MREMEQNDVYDESEFEEGEDLDAEAEEDTSTKITSLWGIPVKGFILGGVIVLLIIRAIVVIAMKKNGGGSSSDIVLPDTNSAYVNTTVSDVFVNYAYIGYVQGDIVTGATIFNSDGSVYDYLRESGTSPVTDASGTIIYGYVSPKDSGTSDTSGTSTSSSSSTSSSTSSIDKETLLTLRKYGYTGNEIELAASTGANLEEMIAAAKLLQDEAAKEALVRMSDSASEEFQTLVNTTQYCMPYQEYVPTTWSDAGYTNEASSYIVNADYEKMPTYGYQLRIKVKIANGTYAFMDVNPTRYAQMPDSGNIVVDVHYTLYGPDEEHIQFYITSLIEKDITTLTVNPEDSAVNLNDVINKGR